MPRSRRPSELAGSRRSHVDDVEWIAPESLVEDGVIDHLKDADAIFGAPGPTQAPDGYLDAIEFAREGQLPYFGCELGMDLAVVEFARTVLSSRPRTAPSSIRCSATRSSSSSIAPELIKGKPIEIFGEQMVRFTKEARLRDWMKADGRREEHRAQFGVNSKYKTQLTRAGLRSRRPTRRSSSCAPRACGSPVLRADLVRSAAPPGEGRAAPDPAGVPQLDCGVARAGSRGGAASSAAALLVRRVLLALRFGLAAFLAFLLLRLARRARRELPLELALGRVVQRRLEALAVARDEPEQVLGLLAAPSACGSGRAEGTGSGSSPRAGSRTPSSFARATFFRHL